MSDSPYRRKVIPYAISILWRAGEGGATGPGTEAFPLFLQQRAINALHDHYRATPEQGILGFLLGNLYECPETSTRYTVIDLVMRLSAQIYADKTTLVISRVWDKMQEELAKSGGRLLGWYHSHPPAGVELPPGDIETHLQYFADPWQVALVLGADATGPLAGFFRPAADALQAPAVLPFYEILDPRAVTPEGKKKSSVRWKNYKPHKPPVLRKSVSAASPAAPSAFPAPAPETEVVIPQATVAMPRLQVPAKPEPPPPPPPPAPAPPLQPPPRARESPSPSGPRRLSVETHRPSRPSHARRFSLSEPPKRKGRGRGGLYAVLAVILLGGAGAGYWYYLRPRFGLWPNAAVPQPVAVPETTLTAPPSAAQPPDTATRTPAPPSAASPSPTPAATRPAPAVTSPGAAASPVTAKLDQLSDTLARLVRNYQDRARLFDTKQIDCTGLARGLVGVESVWISYNAERKALPVPLDADRASRDQILYSAVDSVESHFDRSQCDRP